MNPIACKNAYYVKLGRNGKWEESCLKENIIRIEWTRQTVSDINSGNWSKIQKQLDKEVADKGAATRDYRALKMFCDSTNRDIWITFYQDHLWWCKVTDSIVEEDKISKYRKVDKWYRQDIMGHPLLINQIPGRIAKLQGFRGTACNVSEADELCRLINQQKSPECLEIERSKEELCRTVEDGLRRLHWKDFEILVDLLFRASGWRRISMLGETMKFSDIELEEPITGDLYQVQVKSKASLEDLRKYRKRFEGSKYRQLFFVVHTPEKDLKEGVLTKNNPVQLILPGRLAEMVVEMGLLNWLLNKIR
jgi:hypothetical protein